MPYYSDVLQCCLSLANVVRSSAGYSGCINFPIASDNAESHRILIFGSCLLHNYSLVS